MKVNYTLPGLLPEVTPAAPTEPGERIAEPFGSHLQRLRIPEVTDWRAVLRLNAPPAGAIGIGPPPAPHGIELRDGASQRAWWRDMLHRHARSPERTQRDEGRDPPLERMLGLLSESQRREDEVFARHFAEGGD